MAHILNPNDPGPAWDNERFHRWLAERQVENARDKRNAADKAIRGLERASEKLAEHYTALEDKAKESGDYSFLDKYKPEGYFDFGAAWAKINHAIEQLRPASSAALTAQRGLDDLDAQSAALGESYEKAEGQASRGAITYEQLSAMGTDKQFAQIEAQRKVLHDDLNQLGVPSGRQAWELARDGRESTLAIANTDQTIRDTAFE